MAVNTIDQLLLKGLEIYKEKFERPKPCIAVHAPARVNILGDHVDYNQGLVLPMAIPLYTVALGAPNNTHILKVITCSQVTGETMYTEFPIPTYQTLSPGEPEWANYIRGAIEQFKGFILEGCNIVFVSNIPWGGGLAASTSLVVSAYTFFESLTKERTYDKKEKALRCAKAEHEFSGAPMALMDTLCLIFAKDDHVMLIDCKTTNITHFRLDYENYAFLVVYTRVNRYRKRSEFMERMEQCERACEIMQITTLRDATPAFLKIHRADLTADQDVDMRARHVVAEILRVERAAKALLDGDYKTLGRLMNQSHISLKYDYEVSTKPLDELVELALDVKDVIGARMMGAGLGGCTINLLAKSAMNELMLLIKRKYAAEVDFFFVDPVGGADDISTKIFNLERMRMKISASLSTLMEYAVEMYNMHFKDEQPTNAAYAPGKVNILGDHTDYNQGLMLQMALPMGTLVVGGINDTGFINVYIEEDYAGREENFVSIALPGIQPMDSSGDSWTNIIKGVLMQFDGSINRGFNAVIVSCLPPIVGLGCYSSVVVAFYTFIELITKEFTPSWLEKSKRCYKAERLGTTAHSSLVDHITLITAEENCLNFIDCRTGELETLKFPSQEYAFILADSNVDRYRIGHTFAERETECRELAIVMEVTSLRDVSSEDVENMAKNITLGMYRRGKHVVSEINRVFEGSRALKKKDLQSFGILLLQSHNSLIENYEVTSYAQEQLVAIAVKFDGVLGAKMTGSDYSSCIVVLVHRSEVDKIVEKMNCEYQDHMMIYVVDPKDGVQDVTRLLNLELRRRIEKAEHFVQDMSEESIGSEDMRALSWDLFDLGNEWENWIKKKKKNDWDETAAEVAAAQEDAAAEERARELWSDYGEDGLRSEQSRESRESLALSEHLSKG